MTDSMRSPIHRPALGGSGGRVWLVVSAVLAACFGGAAFAIDLPVARWVKEGAVPGDVRRLLDFPEVAAHGLGVAVLLVGVAAMDPGVWRKASGPRWLPSTDFIRMVAAAYSGGIIVNLLKALVIRVRPRAIDLSGIESTFDTFGEAAAEAAGASGSGLMSFPSGHSAVAAGFAAALAWRYPRAAWYFAAVAVGAMAQRVVTSQHYPSDVGFGAAIGLLAAAVFLRPRQGWSGGSAGG